MRLDTPPLRRRIGLAPLIDVVFLLLIFFMLASRFSQDGAVSLSLGADGGGGDYTGPPRLVDVSVDGVRLNGVPVAMDELASGLQSLVPAPDAVIVVRPTDGVDVQRVVDVLGVLNAGGLTGGTILR